MISVTFFFDLRQSIRYDHTVADNNDPYARLVEEASQNTSEAAVPEAFLVDLFPQSYGLLLLSMFDCIQHFPN